tara:strand:- start:1928 stop:2623 length:696 start_codon:yes stop_codon:yes gene_type:complete
MSTNLSQIIDGTENDDHLVGGAKADLLDGGEGNDSLIAGGGNDILVGGSGNDFLNGGGGADTYVFDFTLRNEGDAIADLFRNGNTPNQNADWSAWSNYLDQLTEWRADLIAQYGTDANESLITDALYKIARDEYGDVPDFDNSYQSFGKLVLDAEGNDIIAQLVIAQGDKIVVDISRAVMETHVTSRVADVNGDGKLDTILEFSGDGQITILGSAYSSVGALWDAGLIVTA